MDLTELYNHIVCYINYLDFLRHLEYDPYILLKLSSISIFGSLAYYVGKIWYSYRFFKNVNISTPKYRFFYGNYLELTKDKNYSEVLREWTKQYGKTYGYYQGHKPILVTSDLEIIQEVFIKQSTNFSARKRVVGSQSDDSPNHMLFTSSRSTWKNLRSIVNPTFSSFRLRELAPTLCKCSTRLNEVLENELDKEIYISDYFKRFTMDTIWNCGFGVDVNIQNDQENELNKRSEEIFSFLGSQSPLHFITIYLHEFQDIFLDFLLLTQILFRRFFDFTKYNPLIWFMDRLYTIIEERKSKNVKKKDYLQILMDTESENLDKVTVDYTNTKLNKKLTIDGIKLNLTSFMLAGYETTSTGLTYATFILIKYPEEQTKLYEIIKSRFESEEEINPDSVQDIEYLDFFIKEVLRFYPIANPAVDRRCTKATIVKEINVPEDLVISVDVMSLHFDPDLWGPVDPNLFYPSRHEVKRNPLAFMAFGNGPRYCIGMKFALIEIKMAICKLLLKYELKAPNDFQTDIELIEVIVRRPKNGLKIILKKRNSSY